MSAPVDVLAIYDQAIFQRRRRLQQITDKRWPPRAIERATAHLAEAEAARAKVATLLAAARTIIESAEYLASQGEPDLARTVYNTGLLAAVADCAVKP